MPKSVHMHNLSILIVSTPENQKQLIEVLIKIDTSPLKIRLSTAFNQALAEMKNNRYAVCLVDHHLGERDGLALIRAAVAGGCRIPVILLVAQPDSELESQARQAGVVGLLVKDRLTAVELEEAVHCAITPAAQTTFYRPGQTAPLQWQDEASQHLAQMTKLYELSNQLVSALTVEEVASLVIEKVVPALEAHSAVINLLDETASHFERSFGPSEPAPRSDGNTMTICRTGQPLIIRDMRAQPGLVQRFLLETGIGASIGLPLRARHQTIGVLYVRYGQVHNFSEREIQTLFTFVNQTAIAIQNARLYEKVNRQNLDLEAKVAERTMELETLYDLSQALGQATQFSDVIRLILLHLYKAVQYDVAASLLTTDTDNTLVLQSQRPLSPKVETQLRMKLLKLLPEAQSRGASCQTLRLHTLQPEATERPQPFIETLGAVIEVPIIIENRRIGMLVVGTEQTQKLGLEQRRLIHIVADQASEAIRRLQSLLEAEYLRLEQVVAHLPNGLIVLDAAGRVVLTNPSAKSYLPGLTKAQTGEKLFKLGPYQIEEVISRASVSKPVELKVEDSLDRTLEVSLKPITSGPEKGGWIIILRDVTDERGIQKRVQQQERMAAIGQLAAGIAHDFNNILTSMIGYAELVQLESTLTEAVHGDLQRITQQGQRAAYLIRQILDFSSQTISEKKPLDLALFLKETVKLLERTIPEYIDISLEAEPDEYTVTADLTQIQQVLTNLAVNARDAMPTGGAMHFHLSRLTAASKSGLPFPEMAPGDWIILTVADTGTGIPSEIQDQIFEPFFTTKEVGKGTGLGLAQVYGIVQQHGGYIQVQSRLGAGTTFSLYFPAHHAAPSGPTLEPSNRILPRGQGETLLVVEDDPAVVNVAQAMLTHLGYRVLTAANGYEALELYQQHQSKIALVLTDITMPQMGGVELAMTLRQKDPLLKIVALTGYPMEIGSKEFLAQGILDWLPKPLKLNDLAQKINRLLHLEAQLLPE